MVTPLLFIAAATLMPQAKEPFVCRIGVLSAEERAELPKLLDTLIERRPKVTELPNGYQLRFPTGDNLFPVAAKWLSAESRCCPFFDISISKARRDGVMTVRLSGPPGVKEFIAMDLPKLHALMSEK